jgi:O-antigen/teichoic acid export membrane protein
MKRGEIAVHVSRGAFYLSLERIVGILSGVVYFALLLRWLGPTKYGILTLALSFTGIATLATGNFEVFLERYAAEYNAHGRLRTLLRAHHLALALKVGLGLIVAVGLISAAPLVAHLFKTPELAGLLPVFTLLVAFDGLSTTGRATLFGLQQYRAIFVVAFVFHVLKTVLVGALWLARTGLTELAIGLVIVTFLQGVAMTVVPTWMLRGARDEVLPGSANSTEPRLLRTMAAYSFPLLGARATFLTGQNLGKIILGKLYEPWLLGYFAFAFQITERFIELTQTAPTALLPSLTHLVSKDERERMRQIFDQALRLIQVGAGVLSFLVFAFAREITLLVGSPLFEPAIPLVRVMALVPLARAAQQPLTMLFQAMRKPGTVLRLALLKFVGEFGMYPLLLPVFGILGAALANVIGAVVSYIAALWLLSRTMPEGARERASASVRSVLVLAPFLGFALLASTWLHGPLSLILRLALMPLGLLAVFALGLVNRYDLVKLGSIPLRAGAMCRTRDAIVGSADSLARVFERRSAV